MSAHTNRITIEPNALEATRPNFKAGQIYRMKDTDRLFIVCDLTNKSYAFIELNDGVAWDAPVKVLDHLVSDTDDWELLYNVVINITV